MRCLGELDVTVGDHLDAVTPGIEEIEERSLQQFAPRSLDEIADRAAVVDDEADMAGAVTVFGRDLGQVDELIAHVDESVGLVPAAQGEGEDPRVEGKR